VAGAGRQRVAELLCRPDKRPLPAKLHLHPETDMAVGTAPTVATGSLQLATAASPGGPILAQTVDQIPVAGKAVRRQIPEVGAGWFNDHVRIRAGAPGNRRPYCDRRTWSNLNCFSYDVATTLTLAAVDPNKQIKPTKPVASGAFFTGLLSGHDSCHGLSHPFRSSLDFAVSEMGVAQCHADAGMAEEPGDHRHRHAVHHRVAGVRVA